MFFISRAKEVVISAIPVAFWMVAIHLMELSVLYRKCGLIWLCNIWYSRSFFLALVVHPLVHQGHHVLGHVIDAAADNAQLVRPLNLLHAGETPFAMSSIFPHRRLDRAADGLGSGSGQAGAHKENDKGVIKPMPSAYTWRWAEKADWDNVEMVSPLYAQRAGHQKSAWSCRPCDVLHPRPGLLAPCLHGKRTVKSGSPP